MTTDDLLRKMAGLAVRITDRRVSVEDASSELYEMWLQCTDDRNKLWTAIEQEGRQPFPCVPCADCKETIPESTGKFCPRCNAGPFGVGCFDAHVAFCDHQETSDEAKGPTMSRDLLPEGVANLPELTAEEKLALDSLGPDFVDRLLTGKIKHPARSRQPQLEPKGPAMKRNHGLTLREESKEEVRKILGMILEKVPLFEITAKLRALADHIDKCRDATPGEPAIDAPSST